MRLPGLPFLILVRKPGCRMRTGMALLWGVALMLVGSLHVVAYSAWDTLRDGRALLLLRHTTAPGLGDPPGFVLDDYRTQRNLDERGRQETRRWGALLRRQWIE